MPVNGILGKKIGMTQLFDNNGEVRPCTVLQAGPCKVMQRKTAAKDGYEAAQIGLIDLKIKQSSVNRPMAGHFGKHDLPPAKFLREFAIIAKDGVGAADEENVKVGDPVLVDIFEEDKFVDVV